MTVVVIGAGVGGLTAAALLAARGREVIVCEAAATPGGKMREVTSGGVAIDAGPTVFTMRWVFDRVFADAGADIADYLDLSPVTTLARHAWGTDRLDLFADTAASADAIGVLAGAAEAARFVRFCDEARRTYTTLEGTYLDAQATNPLGLTARIGLGRPGDLLSIRPFESLWHALGRYFHDPRLRQLFGRYATYSGASPFLAPATLMLIAHVENSGVWRVAGGMHRVARALERLATERGATFRYDAPVARIVTGPGGVEAVELASGERIAASAVVCNGDPQAIAAGCFGRDVARAVPPLRPADRSLSALTVTCAARTEGFPLDHHNVFFGDAYRTEFDDIAAGRLPADPSVYVCAPDRDGDRSNGEAGQGAERLHMIVNAPAIGDGLGAGEIDACLTRTFDRLARCGLTVERVADAVVTTPADFATMFPATGGALYGRASHGWRASFQRPGAATRIPGLYLAGGGTHPGAGVPMAALSGRLAVERMMRDRTA